MSSGNTNSPLAFENKDIFLGYTVINIFFWFIIVFFFVEDSLGIIIFGSKYLLKKSWFFFDISGIIPLLISSFISIGEDYKVFFDKEILFKNKTSSSSFILLVSLFSKFGSGIFKYAFILLFKNKLMLCSVFGMKINWEGKSSFK